MRLRGIGIDLGLSSGAAVLVEADPSRKTITRIETLSVWRRKRAKKISPTELYVNTKSGPEDVARFFLDKTSQFGTEAFVTVKNLKAGQLFLAAGAFNQVG